MAAVQLPPRMALALGSLKTPSFAERIRNGRTNVLVLVLVCHDPTRPSALYSTTNQPGEEPAGAGRVGSALQGTAAGPVAAGRRTVACFEVIEAETTYGWTGSGPQMVLSQKYGQSPLNDAR